MPDDLETTSKQPIQLFISYAHKDESLREELSKHLSILKRQGFISEWHDRMIPPGEKWAARIDDRINQAQVILLLISSDFLASDYCYEIEMKRALERDGQGEAVVIPVILRACDWQGELFGKLQAVPKNAKPVTSWPNQDEAFTNVAEGIRKAVEDLRARAVEPPKPRRLDVKGYEQELMRQEVKEIKVANPYLLGKKFVGREKELNDLTGWLRKVEDQIFCICDLGGTGKSALVWHWLNDQKTRESLIEDGIKQFWCSFYARNFDSIQFLRDLARELGDMRDDEPETYLAQKKLQQFVLQRLKAGKWLLVLDGLEREMGAFINPEHFQVDSEEQDRRNENKEVMVEEKYIRSQIFADFIRELLKTPAKVLITSRLFPEHLKSGDEALPGVISYPFLPMSPDDAIKVWNLSGDPDGSPFQQGFFESVGHHPQLISVVAAAVREQSFNLKEWFEEFSEAEQQACRDVTAPLTARRHRWLDLAVRDLIANRRDAWLTICYIVRRSDAASIDALMNNLVDESGSDEIRPGRFRSAEKLIEVLNYLEKRRLIGVDFTRGMVDVHPVIRGQVMQYIRRQYEPGGRNDEELVRHLESSDDFRDLLVRFLNQSDLDERYRSLSKVLEGFDDYPSTQNVALSLLGKFYPDAQADGRPWLNALPAIRLRREQAWVLQRTAHELMTRGRWDESTTVFNRAIIAYQLCGDLQSIEDCRQSHDWQALYGGSLWEAEKHQLDAVEKKEEERSWDSPFWLALLLSIRQSEHCAGLLQNLPALQSRWTLQTVAEAWFYLDNYEKAADLAREAWNRREIEESSVAQALWEAVTLGMALVRLGRGDEAEEYLEFALSRGTGWYYSLVPKFALAGLIEHHYLKAVNSKRAAEKRDELIKADLVYKQYCKSDPDDVFQIPASEAHLAMARVHLVRGEREDAEGLARRALKISKGNYPPFDYASVVKRATQFLTAELNEPAAEEEGLNFEALEHEERLHRWIEENRQD